MVNAKRKFKDGDFVYDEVNGVCGRIESYQALGYYVLTDLYLPLYDSVAPPEKWNSFLKINSINGEVIIPDYKAFTNTYVQHSRCLVAIEPIPENAKIVINPAKGYYIYDINYSKLLEVVDLEIQCSVSRRSIATYRVSSRIGKSWIITGNILGTSQLNIKNIQKETVVRDWFLKGGIFTVSDELLNTILSWETEIAPFIIKGSLI